MYRLKDLRYLDIYDCTGKKVGSVKDIAIDYYAKKISGFIMQSKVFSKKNYIPIEGVLAIGNTIIARNLSRYNNLTFKDIKGLDIINKNGDLIGVVEEILINKKDFSIKGLVTSAGFFHKFIHGKTILLIGETILGEDNILFLGNNSIVLKSLPHNFFEEVNKV